MRDYRLVRLDANTCRILNRHGVPTVLFANEEVAVESSAIVELEALLGIRETIDALKVSSPDFLDQSSELLRVAVTPDFHKGSGVPVGTVMETCGFAVPAAIGNDVNCGMRLHLTSLDAERVSRELDPLEKVLRHVFFEGGRNIPMTRVQREALLREGLPGLVAVSKNCTEGIWRTFNECMVRDMFHVERQGRLAEASSVVGLDDFMGSAEPSRDSQIGSIGGGNHFVEIQRVEGILDGATAHAWGLKRNMVAIMVHSGSVAIGRQCGNFLRDLVRGLYPRNIKHPGNGIFLLPDRNRFHVEIRRFWDCLHNAANFAFGNRLFLGLMAIESLRSVCGDFEAQLLYDAPHNMVWEEVVEGYPVFLHRKGACPARGMEAMAGTPFAFYGEPVIVPGSMGTPSFVLSGLGNSEALWSASHGAGRTLSRGEALKGNEEAFKEFLNKYRIVTPVDLRRQDIRQRRDILEKKLAQIKQEAPFAYKSIGPIISTLQDSGIAKPVARLVPLMTVKA